jgi:UDP-glucose:(heptosyl)LPS alpha-1,3-glucosyltransferase
LGKEKVILFVSNNFRMKGLRTLMEALARLKKEGGPPLKLLVLGRDRKGPFVRLATNLGISGGVLFAGSTAEPEKYYAAADLLVHPTFYDACSLTVLEALASGLPVLTTASNGASGTMTNDENGFVIENPKDVNLVCERIAYFFDKDPRQRASVHARKAMEQYSLETNYHRLLDVFAEVLNQKGMPRNSV